MPSFDSFDQRFNVNWEIIECLEITYEILDDLQDIRIGLERGLDISTFLSPDFSPLITFLPPPFDPLQTFGKYC
jgi:hypothetical protein